MNLSRNIQIKRCEQKDKQNKIILITGGATGIGRAIALEFVRIKANIIINYNRSERESSKTVETVKKLGAEGIKIKADITKSSEVEAMFDFIDKKYGRLDILVNNAGWTKFVNFKKIFSLTEGMYDHIMDVNLKGAFLCTKNAIRLMRKSRNPSIINIASTSGIDGSGSNIIYCASKAAVIAITKSFAKALAPHIRVNAIAPGFTETHFISTIPKVILDREKKMTPLKKFATPEDVAHVVFCLCQEMKFINGKTIIVDGGRLINI